MEGTRIAAVGTVGRSGSSIAAVVGGVIGVILRVVALRSCLLLLSCASITRSLGRRRLGATPMGVTLNFLISIPTAHRIEVSIEPYLSPLICACGSGIIRAGCLLHELGQEGPIIREGILLRRHLGQDPQRQQSF